MDNDIYYHLIFITGSIAALLNLGLILMIQIYPPNATGVDFNLRLVQISRIPEFFISFSLGPILAVKPIYPLLGGICKGLCYIYKNRSVCLFFFALSLTMSIMIYIVISMQFLSRYNVFVRNRAASYTMTREKTGYLFTLLFLPTVNLIFYQKFELTSDEFNTISYKHLTQVQNLQEMNGTLIIFETRHFTLPMLLFLCECGFLIVCILYGIFFYYIPLDRKLKESVLKSRKETAKKIKKSLNYLRICVFMPIVFALTPMLCGLMLMCLEEIPQALIYIFRSSLFFGPLTYFIVSPVLQAMFAYHKLLKKSKLARIFDYAELF